MGAECPSSLTVREFRLETDYGKVFEIWQRAGVSIRPSDSREEVAKKLLRDREVFLVAALGDLIVGAVTGAWDGRRGWVHHLAVDPAFQRREIGSALIEELERRLSASGCLKVNLLVHVGNVAGRCLYASLGYTEIAGHIPMGKELQ